MTIRTVAPNKDRRSASKVLPRAPKPPVLPCTGLHWPLPLLQADDLHQARVALIFVRAHAPVIKIIKDRFLEMSFSLFEMTIIFLSLCFSEWRRSYSKLYITSTENVTNFEKVFLSLQYLWKRAVRITKKPYTAQREDCVRLGNPCYI